MGTKVSGSVTEKASTTASGLADDGTDTLDIDTDGAVTVKVFVDSDDAPDPTAHPGYELRVYVFASVGGTRRPMEYATLGSDGNPETARSWDIKAMSPAMRLELVNRSGSPADHALYAIALT